MIPSYYCLRSTGLDYWPSLFSPAFFNGMASYFPPNFPILITTQ